ncbi:MAG: glycosyltransferase [Acidobacteriota bacterium]
MSRLTFLPLPEAGHVFPLLKLARRLVAAGHDVQFAGPAELEPLIGDFQYLPTTVSERAPMPARTDTLDRAERRQLAKTANRHETRQWRAPELLDGLRALPKSDLWLLDPYLPACVLGTHALGRDILLVNPTVPSEWAPGVPPNSTTLVPRRDRASRFRLAWWRLRLADALRGSWRAWRGLPSRAGRRRRLMALARQVDFPRRQLLAGTYFPWPALPEIVLCPQVFDLPRPCPPRRRYVEASIDLDRPSVAFPVDRLDPNLKLAYCAGGSQIHLASERLAFFRAVARAFENRPGWQLVLVTGAGVEPSTILDSGNTGDLENTGDLKNTDKPGIIIVERAPQLDILRRAMLCLTHGGLGSVKEAIYFGVVPIVFPLTRDHPGNAARVVYHRIGLKHPFHGLDTDAVDRLVTRIDHDRRFLERVRTMSRAFKRLETQAPSLEAIESRLAHEWSTEVP